MRFDRPHDCCRNGIRAVTVPSQITRCEARGRGRGLYAGAGRRRACTAATLVYGALRGDARRGGRAFATYARTRNAGGGHYNCRYCPAESIAAFSSV